MSTKPFEDIDPERLRTGIVLEARPDRHAKELRAVVIATERNILQPRDSLIAVKTLSWSEPSP